MKKIAINGSGNSVKNFRIVESPMGEINLPPPSLIPLALLTSQMLVKIRGDPNSGALGTEIHAEPRLIIVCGTPSL